MGRKIIKWFFNHWKILAEIGIVIWAIKGMYSVITIGDFFVWLANKTETNIALIKLYITLMEQGVNILLIPFLFYFLSAILILYLLRHH